MDTRKIEFAEEKKKGQEEFLQVPEVGTHKSALGVQFLRNYLRIRGSAT